ncbi:MAG: DMT family transporter [Verrucomicrobiales bacterium]|nr:DMT family transporter [Verrucomicrobiales bacterium]
MKPHRPMLGFLLALNTAVFWGILPIIMKQTLTVMTPVTVVWYRYVFAIAGLGLFLGWRRELPNPWSFARPQFLLFAVAAIGLSGNFIMFSSALQYIGPTGVQVLGQLGPMLLLILSVPVLKERMHRSQAIGAVVLVCGILLFFNSELRRIFAHFDRNALGILLATGAAIIWSGYGVAQKILSRSLTSQQILWLVYCLCALCLLPFAKPASILQMNAWQLGCLLFCGVNTLIAYGSFAEALAIWQAAKTGAVIALTPLFTLLFSDVMHVCWPDLFEATTLNWIGYAGALVVVSGTILSVLGHVWSPFRKPKQAHLNQPPPAL